MSDNQPPRIIIFLSATIIILIVNLFLFPAKEITGPPTLGLTSQDASWKTYRNQQYQFEIKYPSEYFTYQRGQRFYFEEKESGGLMLYLKIIDNSQNLTPKDWFDQDCPCRTEPLLKTHSLSQTKIKAQQALKLTKKEAGPNGDYIIIISANQKIYHFSFTFRQEESQLPEQILASFQPLD